MADGAKVCVTARKQEALKEAVSILGGPDYAIAVAGKAEDTEHQTETFERALEAFGRVDMLVWRGHPISSCRKSRHLHDATRLATAIKGASRGSSSSCDGLAAARLFFPELASSARCWRQITRPVARSENKPLPPTSQTAA